MLILCFCSSMHALYVRDFTACVPRDASCSLASRAQSSDQSHLLEGLKRAEVYSHGDECSAEVVPVGTCAVTLPQAKAAPADGERSLPRTQAPVRPVCHHSVRF